MIEQSISYPLPEFDLSPIKLKLMDAKEGKGWTNELVNRVEVEYRRFLFMNKQYPRLALVPSKLVDDFWHQHILDTKKYLSDCQEYFGYFLHHFPYFGKRGETDAENLKQCWQQTLSLYETLFKESAMDSYAVNCSDCGASSCGACSSQGGGGTSCSGGGSGGGGGGDDKSLNLLLAQDVLNTHIRPSLPQ